jgi:hypothetical protein
MLAHDADIPIPYSSQQPISVVRYPTNVIGEGPPDKPAPLVFSLVEPLRLARAAGLHRGRLAASFSAY